MTERTSLEAMALQSKFNDLKQGPKEDKVAVASGAAVSVVLLLLVVWGIYFLHQIRSGSQQLNLGSAAQDQFNMDNVTQAQQQLQAQFGSPTQDLQDVRAQTAQNGSDQMQVQQMQIQGSSQGSQFTSSNQ